MSDMNVNSQGPVQNWGTEVGQPAPTTQANKTEVTDLTKDVVVRSKQEEGAGGVIPKSTVDHPSLDQPNPNASAHPMSPAGGNPWTTASGFVAVLIALSSVAAVMARNAVADNKALVQGLSAQYEMGVEAGKMARNAKYAEAMADIVGGIGALVSAGVGFGMAGVMIKQTKDTRSMESPYQKTSADLDTRMNNHVSQEGIDKATAERAQLQKDLGTLPANSKAREDHEKLIANKDQQIADMKAYRDADPDNKAAAADKLAKSDGEFADLRRQKEQADTKHEAFKVEEGQLQRQLTQMIGQSLQGVSTGLTDLAKAPIKMIEGNYQMWQQIFQTASQVFANFIQAFTNDMQSHNQMVDSLNQLEQKMADDNTRAMNTHA